MDGNGFDELTRRLAARRSRRSVLRGILGGGAALAAVGAQSTLAAPKNKVDICHWSGSSYQLISVSANAVPAHQAHQNGLDIIAPDFTSAQTCGNCNNACYDIDACTPAACIEGSCQAWSNCGEGEICGETGCETAPPVCTVLTLYATNPSPVDTGVYLDVGESVTVSASGVAGWCCNLQLDANGSGTCGSGFGIPFFCGSIVGVIGGGDIFIDYTPFFSVGTGTDVTASSAGNLVLQYVDGCPECYWDNNGSFEVTIC